MAQLYRDQNPKIFSQDLFTQSATQKHPLGTQWQLNDGRKFVYCYNGGVALTPGTLVQAPASLGANHLNLTTAAAAIGATAIVPTLGATAVVVDYYKDGYIIVNDMTGEGQCFKIRGHAANAGSLALTVNLYDSVRVALDATSQTTLVCNPHKYVITAATTLTGRVVGAAVHDVTINYYFWAQCKGPAAMLTEGTVVIGQPVIPSASAAGAVTPLLETTLIDIVGKVLSVNVTTEYSCIALAIDP